MTIFQQPARELTLSLAGENVRLFTRPGIPHWDTITPAAALLAEHVPLRPGETALLMGCSPSALAVLLARRVAPAPLALAEAHSLALSLARQSLAANHLPAPSGEEDIAPANLDAAVVELPKGRKLARRWLAHAQAFLKPGGQLYLAGANEEGIQAVIKDAAELLDGVTLLAYKKGNRIARLSKNASGPLPSWAAEPGIAPGSWRTFDIHTLAGNFHIHSLPGVFSFDQLDEGTALLLEHLAIPAGGRVLDFGCGYGSIGMFAARRGAAAVDLVDVNLLAVSAAQKNLAHNGIATGRVLAGSLLEAVADQRYDLIAANPPFHTGQEVDYATSQTFIAQAHQLLEPGGRLVLVANRFIRYERLMQEIFGNAVTLAATGKFHLLESVRQPTRKEHTPR